MASKVLRTHCGYGEDCPEIKLAEGGDVRITGYQPGAEHTPENEVTIDVPPTLIPEIVSLDIPDFSTYLRSVRRTPGDIYRVQTLPRYNVPSDDNDLERYLTGEEKPLSPYRAPWGERLAEDAAAGRVWRNLHVVNGPLSDHLCYQFEWQYSFNVEHGQDVRILDASEHPAAVALIRIGDFWVLEHKHVVLCRYDVHARPMGTVAVEASGAHGYIAAAEMAWQLGTPFKAWWDSHPEYHRNADARAA